MSFGHARLSRNLPTLWKLANLFAWSVLISLYCLFEVCILLVHTSPGLCLLLFLIILIRGLSIVLSFQSPIFLFYWFTLCFCSPRHWFLLLPWFFPSFCLLWVKFDLLPISSDGRDLLFPSLGTSGSSMAGSAEGSCSAWLCRREWVVVPSVLPLPHCRSWTLSRGLLWVWGSRLC